MSAPKPYENLSHEELRAIAEVSFDGLRELFAKIKQGEIIDTGAAREALFEVVDALGVEVCRKCGTVDDTNFVHANDSVQSLGFDALCDDCIADEVPTEHCRKSWGRDFDDKVDEIPDDYYA